MRAIQLCLALCTCSWMRQKQRETLSSSSSSLPLHWKGSFSHLLDIFNIHCNLSLSCLHTFPTNDFMNLLNDQEQLVSITLPLGVIRYYRGLLGSGPQLDYEWESSEWAGMPSDSNTHSGTAVGCDCSWSMKNLTRPKDETITWDCFSKLLLSKCFFFKFLKKASWPARSGQL